MNQTLKLPVGIENFEDIRKLGFYYIDKTKYALHAEGQRFESVILHSIGNVRNEDERSMTYCTSKQ